MLSFSVFGMLCRPLILDFDVYSGLTTDLEQFQSSPCLFVVKGKGFEIAILHADERDND